MHRLLRRPRTKPHIGVESWCTSCYAALRPHSVECGYASSCPTEPRLVSEARQAASIGRFREAPTLITVLEVSRSVVLERQHRGQREPTLLGTLVDSSIFPSNAEF